MRNTTRDKRSNMWEEYFARLRAKEEDDGEELTKAFYNLEPQLSLKQLATILNEEDALKRRKYMQQVIESRSKKD